MKDLRVSKGLSHESLSKALVDKYGIRISSDSLMNYEVSEEHRTRAYANQGMRAEYLRCFADFYDVSSDYLLGITDIKSAEPNMQTAVQYTGLSEHNIKFLNTCAMVERYCTLHPPVDASTPTLSFTEWADASGLRQRSREELSHFNKMLGRFQREETEQIGAELQGINGPGAYGIISAWLHLINDLVEMVEDDTQMVGDFISITPTARLGIAKISSSAAIDSNTPNWNTIQNGMQQIAYSDFIRFKAGEVGRAIERHLLEKYGYGND